MSVFVSYSHDNHAHAGRVQGLVDRLRTGGGAGCVRPGYAAVWSERRLAPMEVHYALIVIPVNEVSLGRRRKY
jgi:hypothetical protein